MNFIVNNIFNNLNICTSGINNDQLNAWVSNQISERVPRNLTSQIQKDLATIGEKILFTSEKENLFDKATEAFYESIKKYGMAETLKPLPESIMCLFQRQINQRQEFKEALMDHLNSWIPEMLLGVGVFSTLYGGAFLCTCRPQKCVSLGFVALGLFSMSLGLGQYLGRDPELLERIFLKPHSLNP